nr:hypothetical protein [Pedobacter indicus]
MQHIADHPLGVYSPEQGGGCRGVRITAEPATRTRQHLGANTRLGIAPGRTGSGNHADVRANTEKRPSPLLLSDAWIHGLCSAGRYRLLGRHTLQLWRGSEPAGMERPFMVQPVLSHDRCTGPGSRKTFKKIKTSRGQPEAGRPCGRTGLKVR